MLSQDLQSVPILAYTFISITSVVLAYVTLMDKEDTPSNTSATSMLPSLSSLNPFGNKEAPPQANLISSLTGDGLPEAQAQANKIFGGKKHKNTKRKHNKSPKHKKTRHHHK